MTTSRLESDRIANLNRRTWLKTAGLAALLGLAACGTVSLPTGQGAGVSSSAT
ncbi:MAG: CAP domain-containing protein, partial [Mesorhizobium sp.]